MRLVKGNMLTRDQKREVLASYVHRHLDTTSANDAEWLAKHSFYITRRGRLSRVHKHCEPAFFADLRSIGR